MRKNRYTILVAATIILLAGIFVFAKKPHKAVARYKDRTGPISLTAEWLDTKKAIEDLLKNIEVDPENYKAKLNLAQAYIQEARVTGNHAYYDGAALDLLNDVIENEPANFDALCCKATVLLSQHHFSEGLAVAKQALPLNPNSAFIYGLMCDANVELGNYPEAVKMSDKMISLRPDIRSYARISYLREIHGELKGAIAAGRLAVSSGYPGLEQTEWTRMVLAHLYECTGHLDTAEYEYHTALNERPDYPFAIAGLGRIEKAKGNYKEAIAYYEKANSMITEYSFTDELTDLYRLSGQKEKAEASAKQVIGMLSPGANNDESSSSHGHYADKELAYAYLKMNDVDNALKHAMIEYERRPDNIDVCETVAWVCYKKGDFATANTMINKAIRTHSKNPVLLCRAGLIKIKAGEKEKGIDLIHTGLNQDPFIFDVELKNEASAYVNSI
ncbi:MAG: tetratricopeptide repeat protein [Bacteroidia bacterium]